MYNTPKYNVSSDRNKGLIAISEEGKNSTVKYEESRVTINLTTGSINMSDMFYDETHKFSSAKFATKLKNLYELKAGLNSNFDTFQDLYTELDDNVYKAYHEYGTYMFVQKDCILRTIE